MTADSTGTDSRGILGQSPAESTGTHSREVPGQVLAESTVIYSTEILGCLLANSTGGDTRVSYGQIHGFSPYYRFHYRSS